MSSLDHRWRKSGHLEDFSDEEQAVILLAYPHAATPGDDDNPDHYPSEPYPDESWQEFADDQLDHERTPAQEKLHRKLEGK